jgi:hypothetical protein
MVQTVKRGGSRFYVDPVKPLVTVPGVTSIIGMAPKPFLQYWAAKMTAELAVDSIDYLQRLVDADRDGAIDYLKGASTRYTKTRAKVGSDAHDLFERMLRGENVRRVHPDLEPYRRHYAEFLDVVNPELVSAEDVMWSDTYEYAGSSDAIFYVWLNEDNTPDPTRRFGERVLCMNDNKTSAGTYPEVALQLSAYANADRIITPDNVSEPMPDIEAGTVLHITPDGWEFVPVAIDERVFDVFLALRKVFDWDRNLSKEVLGRPIAQSAAQQIVTGTQRRAK